MEEDKELEELEVELNRRAIMYTQQLRHLPVDSYDELIENIDKYIEEHNLDYQYAAIIHDKDLGQNDEMSAPHVHVQFYSNNKLAMKNLMEMTKEKLKRQFSYMENKVQAFKYLIHDTTNAQSKYQYSVHDVRSNFDYEEFIRKHQSDSKSVDSIITGIINGSITYTDLMEDDDLSLAYAKNRSKFDNALSIAIERKAKAQDNRSLSVVWIHSKYSGIGKTKLAHMISNNYIKASDKNLSIYQSSANNDLFQDYRGQEIVIIDDLKPNDISMTDLLRLLDPHYVGSAKSRYNNKRITANLIIITAILSPVDFFTRMTVDFEQEPIEQLIRRLAYVCEIHKSSENNYKSVAYVYRVDKYEEDSDLQPEDIPVVYGSTENIRTNYYYKHEKKR